ncbi:hypothetical protein ACO0LC_27980 [Undibacterium sp. JH2W]|uniref:hypothetical protein n=1 Tax=Undibacterium sp. JH2W TaxID=3413037 RepID=UPI003BEFFDBA
MKATLLQQLNQNLRIIAQAMAQAGAAFLNADLLPSSPLDLATAELPLQPAQASSQFSLPLHHLGACWQFNIRGETPQVKGTS